MKNKETVGKKIPISLIIIALITSFSLTAHTFTNNAVFLDVAKFANSIAILLGFVIIYQINKYSKKDKK